MCAPCGGVWGPWKVSKNSCVWVLYFVVCGDFKNFQRALCVGSVLWCVETLKIFKEPCVWALWCLVCEDFINFEKNPVCELCTVVCGDFENFQSSTVCAPCGGVWCVRTLKIFEELLCVGSVLCGVWRLWKLSKIPVCGLCTVVCGDFENFQRAPVCGFCAVWCVGTLQLFENSPVCVSSVLCSVWKL